ARGAAEARPPDAGPGPGPAVARARLALLGLLLAAGVMLWVFNLDADWGGAPHLVLVALAGLAAGVPPIRRVAESLLGRIRHPSPRAATRAAVAISFAAAGYLFLTAWLQGAEFVPKVVDEPSYLIGARMLARGLLWLPPHPPDVRPFFDTFNLLVEPTYGSMYFPGTALFHVPAVWLGLPYWTVSLALSAACAGLLYRLVVDLLDGVYAAVAALMLVGLTCFRALAVMLFSQTPMLLMGLAMLQAYLRWRPRRDWRWAALIGALAGWAGITRPADALCYAVAIGVAMLLDLRGGGVHDGTSIERGDNGATTPQPNAHGAAVGDRGAAPRPGPTAAPWAFDGARDRTSPGAPAPLRAWALTLACLVLPALPFLGLQVVQNVGMTGHWWEFPEARYADETYPAPMLGFHTIDPNWRRPALLQKRMLSEAFAASAYAEHRPANVLRTWREDRLPETLRFGLPHPLLAVLLPAGLLGLTDRRRRVVAAVPLLFVGFYAWYVFYIPHYMIVIAPGLFVLVLLGLNAVERGLAAAWPRAGAGLSVGLPLAVAALAVGSLPEFHGGPRDDAMFGGAELPFIEQAMSDLDRQLGPGGRALVLFRFDPAAGSTGGEPVYNADVVRIDDARVIRAHDLGPANATLYRYYATARGEPDRQVFRYTRGRMTLERLGTVGELVGK
ncbi:MAG: hypothetical protein AVDCRST_MAG64-2477, partial [uncultured Phycisphaerae bacterium]